MKVNSKIVGWLFSCFLLLLSQTVFCEVRLPALISDGMVLQRETDVKIWGWADGGEKVKVNFKGKTYNASAGPAQQQQSQQTESDPEVKTSDFMQILCPKCKCKLNIRL